jgi:hypothetical protein
MDMARGWESKDVESQVAASANAHGPHPEEQNESGELDALRRRESLELSRSRVMRDMEEARNPRYRKMLSEALTHLDHELAELAAH